MLDFLGDPDRRGACVSAAKRRAADGLLGERRAVMAAAGTEQPALAVVSKTGRSNIGAQRFGQRMMARHRVLFAALFMQPDRPAGAAWARNL
jgi:hypothetical protein